jgi:hypothetical protein
MVVPVAVARRQIGRNGVSIAGGVALDFTTAADALVRLDVRAGGDFLQINGDWLGALCALERQGTGGFMITEQVKERRAAFYTA